MNKKWIAFVEKHTFWFWSKKNQRFGRKIMVMFQNDFTYREAQPEDLQGWQIRFASECGYYFKQDIDLYSGKITYILTYLDKTGTAAFTYVGYSYKNQEAFNSAWEKFLELRKIEKAVK